MPRPTARTGSARRTPASAWKTPAGTPAASRSTWSCTYDYQQNEKWYVAGPYTDAYGNKGYHIVNAYSGLCLAPSGFSPYSGAAIVQSSCTTDRGYMWFWGSYAGYDYFENVQTGMCINASGGGGANGTPLIQYYCTYGPNTIFDNNLWWRY